jgi:hypothetical protein
MANHIAIKVSSNFFSTMIKVASWFIGGNIVPREFHQIIKFKKKLNKKG